MTTLYEIGAAGYWSGATQEVASDAVVPSGWTARPVPELAAGEFARLDAEGWSVTRQEPPAPQPTALSAKADRHLTKLAFRNRFKPAEKVAIEIASLDDPGAAFALRQQAAQVRVYLQDVAAATFIDLDRPDTRAGVQALEAGGILAPGRGLEILDAPVEENERYRGGVL